MNENCVKCCNRACQNRPFSLGFGSFWYEFAVASVAFAIFALTVFFSVIYYFMPAFAAAK